MRHRLSYLTETDCKTQLPRRYGFFLSTTIWRKNKVKSEWLPEERHFQFEYILLTIVKVSVLFLLTLRNYSFFRKMEDRTIDCEDGSGVQKLSIGWQSWQNSIWRLCRSTKLHTSEVVFFSRQWQRWFSSYHVLIGSPSISFPVRICHFGYQSCQL